MLYTKRIKSALTLLELPKPDLLPKPLDNQVSIVGILWLGNDRRFLVQAQELLFWLDGEAMNNPMGVRSYGFALLLGGMMDTGLGYGSQVV